MKRRYALGRKNYQNKSIDQGLIVTINKMKQYLQTQENKNYGKKAQGVSFVFASRELNKVLKKSRGIL